jgi:hypothetical protein
MRLIHLADGLQLRFPGRSAEFDQGVEIGMLAVLMDTGQAEFNRWIAAENVDQVRALAKQLGYSMVEGDADAEFVELQFRLGAAKPRLRLVHSA